MANVYYHFSVLPVLIAHLSQSAIQGEKNYTRCGSPPRARAFPVFVGFKERCIIIICVISCGACVGKKERGVTLDKRVRRAAKYNFYVMRF